MKAVAAMRPTSDPSTPYDDQFFDAQVAGALASARAVVPVVRELVPARSVVDFGCGLGAWISAFREGGAETILGIDGSYVDPDKLLIGREHFRAADLTRPVRLEKAFDLAVCLEVGEHLPARHAPTLVASLAAAAPVVLFSAAVPGQGGTCHVNERWPAYWDRLFIAEGMSRYDAIRPRIWMNKNVKIWYRQNIFIYSKFRMKSLEESAGFEPDLVLLSREVANSLTFHWSSRIARVLNAMSSVHGRWIRRASPRV